MANNSDRWYFTKEQLDATPSRKCGYDSLKELSYRQQTANFIQDMGQRLKVSQLCINTAIVYMHRFYVFHSFTNFPWYQMAAAALFLAAKVEEQPRKLEYVIRVANMCKNSKDTSIDVNSERYKAQSEDLVFNETVLLQTLGFDVAIDHPHTHVVRCCHLVRASKDLAQSSYFLASNSLHLTTMCLQYKPTVVACFCIHLACKWSSWEIPLSTEKKEWFLYVDPTVTAELLQQLTEEFLTIFASCPSRLKEKIMAIGDNGMHCPTPIANSPFDTDPKKVVPSSDQKEPHPHRTHDSKSEHRSSHSSSSSAHAQKDREQRKLAHQQQQQQQHGVPKVMSDPSKQPQPHGHHRAPIDPKMKQAHARPPPPQQHQPTAPPAVRSEPREILREAARDSPFGIATKVPASRDYLLKPNAAADAPSLGSYNGDKVNRVPTTRVPVKHEQMRRQHLPPQQHAYMKNVNSNASQKIKSPVANSTQNTSKSVPKHPPAPVKQHHHNGTAYSAPVHHSLPILPVKEEVPIVKEMPVKKPSLFSPEKSPIDTKPPMVKQSENLSFSSFSPPPPAGKRSRNYSSGSEPELRPVMKKIDQVEGFENLLRDSTIGINKLHQIPDIITPITDVIKKEEPCINFSKEMKPPEIIPPLCSDNISTVITQPIVNGLETNPTLIRNLLKETPAVSHLPTVANKIEEAPSLPPVPTESKEYHHKSKKKNKDKHKHKDKNREDKEKKKKHKDKDREKHKHKSEPVELPAAEPIKIKIQKDKIQPTNPLKIKIPIPKDVKTEPEGIAVPPIGLKIKIPREKITNCEMEKSSSRKRERSSPGDAPPTKQSRTQQQHKDQKQNGRSSYSKVSNNIPYSKSSAAAPAAPPTYNSLPMYQQQQQQQQQQHQGMYYYAPQMGQPYMYTDGQQMYNYYGYAFPPEMYQQSLPGSNPPLPMDAPPVIPPPPPPE